MRLVMSIGGGRAFDILKGFKSKALDVLSDQVSIFGAHSALEAGPFNLKRVLLGWTCPYQTGHSAWLDNLLAMNSRGERMRKPECGWMLL